MPRLTLWAQASSILFLKMVKATCWFGHKATARQSRDSRCAALLCVSCDINPTVDSQTNDVPNCSGSISACRVLANLNYVASSWTVIGPICLWNFPLLVLLKNKPQARSNLTYYARSN